MIKFSSTSIAILGLFVLQGIFSCSGPEQKVAPGYIGSASKNGDSTTADSNGTASPSTVPSISPTPSTPTPAPTPVPTPTPVPVPVPTPVPTPVPVPVPAPVPTPPAPTPVPEKETGEQIFGSRCLGCHSTSRVGDPTAQELLTTIKNRNPHSRFGDWLTADEAALVAAYLKTH